MQFRILLMVSVLWIFGCEAPTEKLTVVSLFSGQALYDDIATYASFGEHRTGMLGDSLTTDWIYGQLEAAGFEVAFQDVATRQYFCESATLQTPKHQLELFPHWWLPEEMASFEKYGSISLYDTTTTDYDQQVVFLPFQTNPNVAYLEAKFVEVLEDLAERNASLVIAGLRDVSDEIYLFNVTPETKLPLPVLVSRPGDELALLDICETVQETTITVKGAYRNIISRNVVAERNSDDSGENLIVISTPTTGWFSCVGERGPGIALFLAFAKWIDQNEIKGNFRFVASTGHELTHIGANHYLSESAPPVDKTKIWIHLGASLMVHDFELQEGVWQRNGKPNDLRKVFNSSDDLSYMFEKHFKEIGFFTIPGRTVGEVNNVKDFGYKSYLGFGGKHHYFHTPKDDLEVVSPELLEELGVVFEQVFDELVVAR